MQEAVLPPAQPQFSRPFNVVAQVISWIAHPIFIPAYVAMVLLFYHPLNMLLLPAENRTMIMAMVLINTILLPGFTVFLCWRLGFLKSIYMETMRERIIPLNVVIIFYFWAYYVARNREIIPPGLQQWLLGVFLCSCAAMFTNIFKKVSLHTIGAGGLVAFCAWQQATDKYWPDFLLIPALLLAGLVGTARLIRGAHEPSEIYAGYLAGIICQVAAGIIMGL